MAETTNEPAAASTTTRKDVVVDDVGTPHSEAMRELAEDLPEKDKVQVAHKNALLADSAQEEAREKVKIVDASPNAPETPSGTALKKTAGIASDSERGEQYSRVKAAVRHGGAVPDSL
jgi:hypothetical protein